jgi:amino acid transporter
MSEGFTPQSLGAKVPVVPGEHERLRQGALGLIDIAAATMANIGPAMSFYFGFGYLAYTAGLASPLTIIAAGIAILFLGNTLSEFTKVMPSTGGFISFIGKTFGGRTAVTTAILVGVGYIAAMASVIAIVGGFFQMILQHYNVSGLEKVPWIIWTLIFLTLAALMMVRGISISTKIAGFFFAFEMTILLVVSIVTLDQVSRLHQLQAVRAPQHHGWLQRDWPKGFPLAIYLFIGWENSAALAEETKDPRKNVPKAVFTSTLIMLVAYVLFAFSTVVGFKDNVGTLSSGAVPFFTVAGEIAARRSLLRLARGHDLDAGGAHRRHQLAGPLDLQRRPRGTAAKFMGKVDAKRRTPVNALFVFLGCGLLIIGVWGLGHIIGGHATSGSMSALTMFDESSTFGTILVLLVYGLSNLALPFYYKKHYPERLQHVPSRRVADPWGAVRSSCRSTTSASRRLTAPYSWYPYMALGVVIIAIIYASVLVSRDPGISDRVGSIVADE